jgi:sterol 3beta-glucosyltransferase
VTVLHHSRELNAVCIIQQAADGQEKPSDRLSVRPPVDGCGSRSSAQYNMGPSESSKLRESLGRRLTKRRATPRRVSMEFPERLRGGDNTHENVTAGATSRAMNQSIFSMIAAAGSTADFQSRFDEPSSESEDEGTEDEGLSQTVPTLTTTQKSTPSDLRPTKSSESKSQRSCSKNRLIKSMHKLKLKPIRERKSISSADDHMSASQILAPRPKAAEPSEPESPEPVSGEAPMLSRILKAEAEMKETAHEVDMADQDATVDTSSKHTAPVSLAQRLMEIFEFEKPEEVISEWPCWLLQSVLVQGFMYVTQKHICFYAYLPKKAVSPSLIMIHTLSDIAKTTVTKSGYLSKRGLHNPRYNRYYVQLKGDVLSYYQDSSKIYYPSGQIDLRRGIEANLASVKDKSKDNCHFVLTTDKREYMFKADSPASAKDWIKLLQKVIFRTHNDGDSIKVSLPIENVMDIEDNQVLDFASTIKIRVIDNDETYAIDEVRLERNITGELKFLTPS